jgi:hypothetical protein
MVLGISKASHKDQPPALALDSIARVIDRIASPMAPMSSQRIASPTSVADGLRLRQHILVAETAGDTP